ncbi:MAG TPA: DUF72 domain-containing protein [Gammaproteobacteria bacterium]|nr:DUF72 domain-containing protein [Gammaproteobacteria bacterium]
MQLYCGTSGYSYKEWKGAFYPYKLPAGEMLAFYSTRLSAVEINNTFYRMPAPELFEAWLRQVPESFRFSVKANRRITHIKRLADCADEARYFFTAAATLGEQLGAVLVQLPPHFRIDVERLRAFLALVPERVPTAFEFRHESWRDSAVFDALEQHGAAWVTVDETGDAPPAALPETAPWTYLRLRAPQYSLEALRAWHAYCARFDGAFVFFKHEGEGTGPAFAQRMMQL